MTNKRIFKAEQLDATATGWIVDLRNDNVFDRDCTATFRTKREAELFYDLVVVQGVDPDEAEYIMMRDAK